MLAKVYITLKKGVLDPQGKAVLNGLKSLGFAETTDVRVGKYIELTVADGDPEQVRERIDGMCKKLLANTVIEQYRIEVG